MKRKGNAVLITALVGVLTFSGCGASGLKGAASAEPSFTEESGEEKSVSAKEASAGNAAEDEKTDSAAKTDKAAEEEKSDKTESGTVDTEKSGADASEMNDKDAKEGDLEESADIRRTEFVIEDGVLTGYERGEERMIIIPDGVTKIADGTFAYDDSIEMVIFPEGLTEIGADAFHECTELKKVVLPDSLERIGDNAFFYCLQLSRFATPRNLQSIGESAFYYCSRMKEFGGNSALTEIGEHAFAQSGIRYLSFFENEKLAEIPAGICELCSNLERIILPKSVEKIGAKAFYGCSELATIEMPEQMKLIDEGAFKGCGQIGDITTGAEVISKEAFAGSGIGQVKILKDCTQIGEQAFPISACTSFTVEEGNPSFASEDGVLFSKEKDVLIAYPGGREQEIYKIPDSVEKIESYAFCGAKTEQVRFPEKLKEIGKNAFEKSKLLFVRFPNTENPITLGDNAFSACSELTDVYLGTGIKELPDNVFYQCGKLSSVMQPDNLEQISPSAFRGCGKLGKDYSEIGLEKAEAFSVVDGVLLSADGTKLLAYPAMQMDVISDMSMDMQAFMEMQKNEEEAVTEYTVPESVETIAENAFSGSSITTLHISSPETQLMEHSFGYTREGYPVKDAVIIEEEASESDKDSGAYTYAEENGIAYFTGDVADTLTEVTLKTGERYDFSIENTDAEKVLYTTDNAAVATVSEEGKVRAVAGGKATIGALTGGKYFLCNVIVTADKEAEKDSFGDYIVCGEPVDPAMSAMMETAGSVETAGEDDGSAEKAVESEESGPEAAKSEAASEESGPEAAKSEDASEAAREQEYDMTFAQWENEYVKLNSSHVLDETYYPAIRQYSSNDYGFIKACIAGKDSEYYKNMEKAGIEIGSQFNAVANDLVKELDADLDVPYDTVCYSGTSDVTMYTGAGNSLQEMIDAIGETITTTNVVSTSLSRAVAETHTNFSVNGTMLIFYVPEGFDDGIYLDYFTEFSNERELLLNKGIKLKVIDAGICRAELFMGLGPDSVSAERYLKLQVLE